QGNLIATYEGLGTYPSRQRAQALRPDDAARSREQRRFWPSKIDTSTTTWSGETSGEGTPLLLNAHMDRVPPGLGHQPILRDGILYSDGTTNLGADDAAGIVIILEVVRRTLEQQLPHPPLILLFTVQEEAGLCGASGFDSAPWHVADGIVFDNAFEPGVVVSTGAAYEAFDVA